MLGVASGLVAGLVAITPAAGFVSPMARARDRRDRGRDLLRRVLLKARLGYDDALDAFGVHGVGGATGALLTGVFARAAAQQAASAAASTLARQAGDRDRRPRPRGPRW